VLALIRLAAVALFFAAERLVAHPVENTAPFAALLGVAAVYALAALAAELRARPRPAPVALTAVDLLLICALVETSGGPFSPLRSAFFVLPIGAALLLRPSATLLASVASVMAYTVIALTYPGAQDVRPDAGGFELTQALFLGWTGAAATLLSALLARWARRGRPATLFLCGFAVSSAGNLLTGLAPAVAAAFAIQVVRGLGISLIEVGHNTLLQRWVPRAMRARVFANLYGAIGLAAGLSYALGGPFLDLTSPRVTFVVAGAGGLLATVATALLLLPALARQPRDAAADDAE
jgi:hypothetical protein